MVLSGFLCGSGENNNKAWSSRERFYDSFSSTFSQSISSLVGENERAS